jgi:hypothetical protein
MVKQAINENSKLSAMDLSVFGKGSFENRTNIPSESDVDVGVGSNLHFLNFYPPGSTQSNFGFIDSPYTFSEFKHDVTRAIEAKFGVGEVTVGDKSIKVRSNTARVSADVVPHFVHRLYDAEGHHREGVAMKDGQGRELYNWPDQDYRNAVAKNDRTGTRYKSLVRILKSLKIEMEKSGRRSPSRIASYLIACLAWNVPENLLASDSYVEMVLASLDFLSLATSDSNQVRGWTEINEVKYLFHDAQAWSLPETRMFLIDARAFLRERGL